MPSPRYRFGGSFKKLGAESNGISGTFCAFALAFICAGVSPAVWVCARAKVARANSRTTAAKQNCRSLVISTSFTQSAERDSIIRVGRSPSSPPIVAAQDQRFRNQKGFEKGRREGS